MIPHPDDRTIEAFAIGALEDDAAFVAHVGGCDICSAKLRREATLELQLMEVAEAQIEHLAARAKNPPRRKLARRAIVPVAFGFAAAAAVVVHFGREALLERQRLAAAAKPVPVVVCPDGPHQMRCVAEAHRAGAYLEYPRGAAADPGTISGLTVKLTVRYPALSPVPPEVQEAIDRLQEPISRCIDKSLSVQRAPVESGSFSLLLRLSNGGVVDPPTFSSRVLFPDGGDELREPLSQLVGCTMHAARNADWRKVHSDRVEIDAQYVWRE